MRQVICRLFYFILFNSVARKACLNRADGRLMTYYINMVNIFFNDAYSKICRCIWLLILLAPRTAFSIISLFDVAAHQDFPGVHQAQQRLKPRLYPQRVSSACRQPVHWQTNETVRQQQLSPQCFWRYLRLELTCCSMESCDCLLQRFCLRLQIKQ